MRIRIPPPLACLGLLLGGGNVLGILLCLGLHLGDLAGVAGLAAMPVSRPFGGGLHVRPLLGFGLLWVLNLYNFMDGIDGIAAVQCILAAGCIGLLVLVLSGLGVWILLTLAERVAQFSQGHLLVHYLKRDRIPAVVRRPIPDRDGASLLLFIS